MIDFVDIAPNVESMFRNSNLECFEIARLNVPTTKQSIVMSIIPMMNGIRDDRIIDAKITQLVFSELYDSLVKSISKKVYEDGTKHFLNLTSQSVGNLSSFMAGELVCKDILNLGSNYLLSNSRISSMIADNRFFVGLNLPIKNVMICKIGSLNKTEIFLDPIIKWEENYILTFDKCYIDFSNFRSSIIEEATLQPKLSVRYDLSFSIINPKVLFIFQDDHLSHFQEFKSQYRNGRIDSILESD